MLERFAGAYVHEKPEPAKPWEDATLVAVPGYRALAAAYAGVAVGRGIFRIHSAADGPGFRAAVDEAFPEYRGRVVPFARDWLGRAFAVDLGRVVDGEPHLLLMEPGSGDAYDVDAPISTFFDNELVDEPDTYLESEFFEDWRASGGGMPGPTECVGFRLPLFLGGKGSVDNLEVTDVDVYWGVCGQLRAQTKDLPPGTRIGGVGIE
jgi:hypothetical protein